MSVGKCNLGTFSPSSFGKKRTSLRILKTTGLPEDFALVAVQEKRIPSSRWPSFYLVCLGAHKVRNSLRASVEGEEEDEKKTNRNTSCRMNFQSFLRKGMFAATSATASMKSTAYPLFSGNPVARVRTLRLNIRQFFHTFWKNCACPCMTTGTSTSGARNRTRVISFDFCTAWMVGTWRCNNTGTSTIMPLCWICGTSTVFCAF